MTTDKNPIPADEYATVAKNVPIMSVDLLIHHDEGLVLGKRRNKPAKAEWFVPGGIVLKGGLAAKRFIELRRQSWGPT